MLWKHTEHRTNNVEVRCLACSFSAHAQLARENLPLHLELVVYFALRHVLPAANAPLAAVVLYVLVVHMLYNKGFMPAASLGACVGRCTAQSVADSYAVCADPQGAQAGHQCRLHPGCAPACACTHAADPSACSVACWRALQLQTPGPPLQSWHALRLDQVQATTSTSTSTSSTWCASPAVSEALTVP